MSGSEPTTGGKAPLRRRILGSALSALVGWLTLTLIIVSGTIHERFQRFPDPYAWQNCAMMSVIAFGFVLITWLFVLVPLYLFVPSSSRLWHWSVCTTCGALAGAFIMGAVCGFGMRESGITSLVVLAAITGGATCLFGALTASRFQYAGRASNVD